MPTPIVLIGIGNQYRRDDGVGLAVIGALKARGLPNILITECTGDGTKLMEIWGTARKVILIDAVSSGAKPGTIYRFDTLTQPFPAHFSFHSTHAFGVAEAIELARALDQLPPLLIVYAIEGKNFTTGVGLSPEVENTVRKVVEQVRDEVLEHSSEKC